ncbi:MAG: P-II family nitrogen regulator [Planctomycetota bacterium]
MGTVKLVTAVLAPDKLDAVAEALAEREVFRMTVTDCRGVARAGAGGPALADKVRLEIAVNEAFLQPTLEAIRSAGSLSDEEGSGFGKIFVSDLLDVVRIRTGERGPDAI